MRWYRPRRAHAAAHNTAVVPLVGSVTHTPLPRGLLRWCSSSSAVIPHVPIRDERIAALHAVWRVLRPGGLLAMTTHNRRCHWKFRLYFACANRWRRLARRLGHDSGLEDFDRWTTRISKGGWREPAFFHMYDFDEAIADLQAAKFEVCGHRSLDWVRSHSRWLAPSRIPGPTPLTHFTGQN